MHTPDQFAAFARLKERLLQGGVAPRHVRRLIAELADHYDDVLDDELDKGLSADAARVAAWARMGAEDDVVGSILARPELQSLPARFPRLIFGLGPFALWIATIVASGYGLMLLFHVLRTVGLLPPSGTPEPTWLHGPASAACFFYAHILPLIIGAGVMVAAARQRVAPLWPMVGAGVISLVAALISIDVAFAQSVGEKGRLSIGLGVAAEQLPQTVAMTALYAGLLMLPYIAWMRRRSAV